MEEEIRAEALTRKVGSFSRFLELAAQESGTSPNLSKLSMEAGVSVPTIREYYFFDIGVRNALARMPLESAAAQMLKGPLFEHAVMLEIIRRMRAMRKDWRVCFWRTAAGAEVDCILDMGERVIPIEIKASRSVRKADVKGLSIFLADYPNVAKEGFVITMGGMPERLTENIVAIPWNFL